MQRHVAPAEAGEQELEPGREVGEAPDVMADDPAAEIVGQRRAVREHELNVGLERRARDRLRLARERVIVAHDGRDVEGAEKIRGEVARVVRTHRRDRELRHAFAQPLLRPAEVFGEDRDREPRELQAQRLEARDQRFVRKDRIDGEVSSGSMSEAMLAARALSSSARSRRRRASLISASPARVSRGVFPDRSNSATPRWDSSAAIDWLTADCTRPSFRAAAEKLPCVDRGDEDPHLVEG